MWEQLNRIIKDNGAIVLFGNEPFSSLLRCSNLKNYKYDWIWNKENGGNFAVCKYRPLGQTENISVFGELRTTLKSGGFFFWLHRQCLQSQATNARQCRGIRLHRGLFQALSSFSRTKQFYIFRSMNISVT